MSVTLTKDNIATAARYNDADSEELGRLEQWADRYDVSVHGLMYVAEQRAMRIGLLRDGRDPRREVSPTRFTTIQLSTATRREMIHYQSAWVDGFACGLRAERIRS